jgi:hypothetical protein
VPLAPITQPGIVERHSTRGMLQHVYGVARTLGDQVPDIIAFARIRAEAQ